MATDDKRSKASNPIGALSEEQRKFVASAVIDGLIRPGSFTFFNPIATEGGDYNQNGGPYNQGGGGNHNQGGDGGYNQHAATLTPDIDQLEVTNLIDVLQSIQRLRR